MPENTTVPALERALDVLECLAQGEGKTMKEITEELGIPGASLFRILKNLTCRGYLLKLEGQPVRYTLGYQILHLAARYSDTASLGSLARPYMERLSGLTGQTVQFAVCRGGAFMYIEQVLSAAPVNIMARLYTPMELNASAGAKCILAQMDPECQRKVIREAGLKKKTQYTIVDEDVLMAELEATRQRGYGVDREEFALGIGCIAVPVFGAGNQCVGALGITGRVEDYRREKEFEDLKEQILRTAQEISARLRGGSQF